MVDRKRLESGTSSHRTGNATPSPAINTADATIRVLMVDLPFPDAVDETVEHRQVALFGHLLVLAQLYLGRSPVNV